MNWISVVRYIIFLTEEAELIHSNSTPALMLNQAEYK